MKNSNLPSPLGQGKTQTSTHFSRQNPPQSPLIMGTGDKNSSLDKGRSGGISFLPPYGGGTFCKAKGGGARAFTLVELIIVITILAILATIAFMSFQGYMKQSRDAVRVSDLASASKGLSIFFTKSGVYPEAENPVTITASGNTLSSQGTLGESVVRAINMNQVPLDPVDQSKYTYSTNAQKTKYQLMSYTENASLASMMTQSYAQDLTDRGIQMQGDGLGIVLNPDNSLPTTSSVDAYSGSQTYKIVFDNDTVLEGSGNLVFSQIYNMRDDLLKNKELAKLDNALVGYWDMETLISPGGIDYIQDLSKYESHLGCYNSGVLESCANNLEAPHFAKGLQGSGIQILGSGPHTDTKTLYDYLLQDNAKGNYNNFDLISMVFNIKIDGHKPFLGSGSYNDFFIFSRDTRSTNNGWCNIGYIGAPSRTTYLYDNIYAGKSDTACSGQTISSPSSISGVQRKIGQWYQFGVVISGNRMTYYADGTQLGSIVYTGSFGNYNYPLMLGNAPHGWQNLNGTIDEVRIYNRALSDSEIQALYSATK